jgi:hypothetical protein
MKTMILEKRVSLLSHAMGTSYRDAVEACFKGKVTLQVSADSEAEETPEMSTSLKVGLCSARPTSAEQMSRMKSGEHLERSRERKPILSNV